MTAQIHATITVNAPIDTVFDVLADPANHAAIDGTGWVRESLDGKRITQTGQIFRMAMHHDNPAVPEKDYEMSNRVEVFDPPSAIGWLPGQAPNDRGNMTGNSELTFGGWFWRYDLEAQGRERTRVTLTYDWSQVPAQLREHIQFPPFDPSHLDNSLKHLAELAAG